jgi:osmotically-inducible protein OsmY
MVARRFARATAALVTLLVIAAFMGGYWVGRRGVQLIPERSAVGTTGEIDRNEARETGAKLGEKAASVAERVGEAAQRVDERISDAALTTRIKSKMALDDHVDAAAIDVDTRDGVVTLEGRVQSDEERQRAVRLAEETKGVTSVVDRLELTK